MFEVIVEPTATSTDVTIVSEAADVALDGVPVECADADGAMRTLTAGSRAFQLEAPGAGRPDEIARHPRQRRHRRLQPPPSTSLGTRTTAGRRRRSRRHGGQHRRCGSVARTIEMRSCCRSASRSRPSGPAIITVDLGADRALAIAGSEQVRSALARTLVVEAATLHGPADLDIVVLTSPDRVAAWDWAKWLPHVGLDGPPAIWSSAHDIERWVALTGRAGRVDHDAPARRSPHDRRGRRP